MSWQIASAGLVGLALILAVSIYAFARLRIERERTIQALVQRGLTGEEFIRAAGVSRRRDLDLRRGLLLMGVGVAWAGVTFFIGGSAWKMGGAPLAIGLVYLLLWTIDGRPR